MGNIPGKGLSVDDGSLQTAKNKIMTIAEKIDSAVECVAEEDQQLSAEFCGEAAAIFGSIAHSSGANGEQTQHTLFAIAEQLGQYSDQVMQINQYAADLAGGTRK